MPRQEFGAFLRATRERLAPVDVGLPDSGRRRTPGLRREEVAMLAGVSVTWYTRLEQGRDVTPSAQVLDALAGALRMNPRQRRHLLDLQAFAQPPASTAEPPDPLLPAVLAALDPYPAYLVDDRGDRLAWNRAHTVLLGDPDTQRNLYWVLFTDQRVRAMVRNWRRLALTMLAEYRAASVRHRGDPGFAELTAALRQASREFRTWWDSGATADFQPAHWEFDHPDLGALHLDYTTLAAPSGRMVVAVPADRASADRLRGAVSGRGAPAAPGPG